jgi:hypothetical protein
MDITQQLIELASILKTASNPSSSTSAWMFSLAVRLRTSLMTSPGLETRLSMPILFLVREHYQTADHFHVQFEGAVTEEQVALDHLVKTEHC